MIENWWMWLRKVRGKKFGSRMLACRRVKALCVGVSRKILYEVLRKLPL